MNSFLESKAMAKVLRQSLAERNIILSHSECLELMAKQFGFADWNVLSAQIETAKSRQTPLEMASGWFATGVTDPTRYRIGLDPSAFGTAMIECVVNREVDLGKERFACMMQSIDAENYKGMKLKLTANLRCEDADLGTLWMRIDGIERGSLRFDNMMQRDQNGPVKGTLGWTTRSIVLDVPDDASSIHYGFFLKGYGKIWVRKFHIQIAADDALTTHTGAKGLERSALPSQPINLEFAHE